jgi:TonB family protein
MNTELLARNIAAHWVQSGLIAVAALVAVRLFRPTEPRIRLAALQFTLALTMLLPLVQPWRSAELAAGVVTVAFAPGAAGGQFLATTTESVRSPEFSGMAVLVVLVSGVVLRLLWLSGGVYRLLRIGARAHGVETPDTARDLEAKLGVSPRYFEHDEHGSPATFGIFNPVVVLPAAFASLDRSTQQAIVCHELIHVKRRDAAVAIAEEVVAALLWFHPWVWLIRLRLRIEREHVIDKLVIDHLGNRSGYVRCLVLMSGHDLAPHLSAGMLDARALRTRIDAILREEPMSRRHVATVVGGLIAVLTGAVWLATWAVPLQAQDVPQASATGGASAPRKLISIPYAEYPRDAVEKRVSGVVAVDIVVNQSGDVSTGAIVSGPTELRAEAFKAALGLKFDAGSEMTPMRALIEYRLTSDSWGVRVTAVDPETVSQSRPQVASTSPLSGLRVGNGIRAPKKIKDVPPEYPDKAQEMGVRGVVILEARIDENGNVSDTRILRSVPLLDQAAVDAVKQWQYTPTLLNGVAVPVVMTVTVNFSMRTQVQLRINMPDGTLVLLRVNANGGIGRTEYPAMSRFGFAPFVDQDPAVTTVKVAIYEFGEEGTAPRSLGSVELAPGAGIVQTATTPSFGIQVIKVDR